MMKKRTLLFLLVVSSCLKVFAQNECGVRKVNSAGLVHHGYDAYLGQWPWHVGLFLIGLEDRTSEYICGGSLINEYFVLTAAHCCFDGILQLNPNRLLAHVGQTCIYKNNEQVQRHEVQEIMVHKSFASTKFKYDIAVLGLGTKVKFNDYVIPVCLWRSFDQNFDSLKETNGAVTGLGLIEGDKYPNCLKNANLPIFTIWECLESNANLYAPHFTEGSFCAGYKNGTTLCPGDSGGGMFIEQGNFFYLRGIVSFTSRANFEKCNTKDYVGFQSVDQYIDWIDELTKSRNPNRISLETTTETIIDNPEQSLYLLESLKSHGYWFENNNTKFSIGRRGDTKGFMSFKTPEALKEMKNIIECNRKPGNFWQGCLSQLDRLTNAVITGTTDESKYTCKVNQGQEGWFSGRYSKTQQGCYIGHQGKEVFSTNCEILVNHEGKFVPSTVDISRNSFLAGHLANGVPMYICRGQEQGSIPLSIGYTTRGWTFCVVAYKGQEHEVSNYEIYVNTIDNDLPQELMRLPSYGYSVRRSGQSILISKGRDEITEITNFGYFINILPAINFGC